MDTNMYVLHITVGIMFFKWTLELNLSTLQNKYFMLYYPTLLSSFLYWYINNVYTNIYTFQITRIFLHLNKHAIVKATIYTLVYLFTNVTTIEIPMMYVMYNK